MRAAAAGVAGSVAGVVAGLVLGASGSALAGHALFSDVTDDDVHADGIHYASRQGLVEGFPDGTFRPQQDVSRGQLATILERQGAYRGPVYRLTPACGSLEMVLNEVNMRGSGLATVAYSVDGGERRELVGPVPDDGTPFSFTAAGPGVVTVYVDGLAQVSTPTGEGCTE